MESNTKKVRNYNPTVFPKGETSSDTAKAINGRIDTMMNSVAVFYAEIRWVMIIFLTAVVSIGIASYPPCFRNIRYQSPSSRKQNVHIPQCMA